MAEEVREYVEMKSNDSDETSIELKIPPVTQSINYLVYNCLASLEFMVSTISLIFYVTLNTSTTLIVLSGLGLLILSGGCLLSFLAVSRLDSKKQTYALIAFCIAALLCFTTAVISLSSTFSKHKPLLNTAFYSNMPNDESYHSSSVHPTPHSPYNYYNYPSSSYYSTYNGGSSNSYSSYNPSKNYYSSPYYSGYNSYNSYSTSSPSNAYYGSYSYPGYTQYSQPYYSYSQYSGPAYTSYSYHSKPYSYYNQYSYPAYSSYNPYSYNGYSSPSVSVSYSYSYSYTYSDPSPHTVSYSYSYFSSSSQSGSSYSTSTSYNDYSPYNSYSNQYWFTESSSTPYGSTYTSYNPYTGSRASTVSYRSSDPEMYRPAPPMMFESSKEVSESKTSNILWPILFFVIQGLLFVALITQANLLRSNLKEKKLLSFEQSVLRSEPQKI